MVCTVETFLDSVEDSLIDVRCSFAFSIASGFSNSSFLKRFSG